MLNEQRNAEAEDAGGTAREPGRREELLETAARLFAENGFRGTSIRDIAKNLGVSVSVIYHYFQSKEGLWSAILDYSIKELPGRLEAAVAGGGHAVERFRRLLRAHLASSAYYQKESKIFLIDSDRLSASGDNASRDIQKRILELYVGVIEEMRAEGLVKTAHIKILAFNVLGVVNWYLRWYRPDGPLMPDQVFEEIIAFVLYGAVGVPPGRG